MEIKKVSRPELEKIATSLIEPEIQRNREEILSLQDEFAALKEIMESAKKRRQVSANRFEESIRRMQADEVARNAEQRKRNETFQGYQGAINRNSKTAQQAALSVTKLEGRLRVLERQIREIRDLLTGDEK
jgi:chromosome segregation ATPase